MFNIDYQSEDFQFGIIPNGADTLTATWDDLLWAAITVGRPNLHYVFMHGLASFYEAIFRLSLLRMSLQQETSSGGQLLMTEALKSLDPTEKGAINYFLGMVFCKLFSAQLLDTPWLLHLDVFRDQLAVRLLSGQSRPDLIGQNGSTGEWHSFESKGRMKKPSEQTKRDAKSQANRLVSINGQNCSLRIASFSYFRKDVLTYYWRDPIPDEKNKMQLPEPDWRWRYYYECAFALFNHADKTTRWIDDFPARRLENEDIAISIHPGILGLLEEGHWAQARNLASNLKQEFTASGFRPDGITVKAGESWRKFDS